MIDPLQVLSEEPTAVTPHGGFCGGESQQWLSYPTNLHVRFDERGGEMRSHVRSCFAKRNETLAEALKRLRTWAGRATTL